MDVCFRPPFPSSCRIALCIGLAFAGITLRLLLTRINILTFTYPGLSNDPVSLPLTLSFSLTINSSLSVNIYCVFSSPTQCAPILIHFHLFFNFSGGHDIGFSLQLWGDLKKKKRNSPTWACTRKLENKLLETGSLSVSVLQFNAVVKKSIIKTLYSSVLYLARVVT